MKIKNCFYFRRAAAAIALFFAIPMLTAAGQFDALHQGIAQNTDTLIGNWQQFFPGLEGQINAAFEEGRCSLPIEIIGIRRRCRQPGSHGRIRRA